MNKANNGWEPIEVAPRSTFIVTSAGNQVDAVYLELYCPDNVGPHTDPVAGICIGWWEPLMKPACWFGESGFPLKPTHWRYLRPAPIDAKRKGKP